MTTSSTSLTQMIHALRADVYTALLSAQAVQHWLVPDGMICQVHAFEPRAGGYFRISLTYDSPAGQGKSSTHTDTYHGTFVELIPNLKVMQVMEFETDDPRMQGEMRVAYELTDAADGTLLHALHDSVPEGISPADNATGWRMSLEKLKHLLEAS